MPEDDQVSDETTPDEGETREQKTREGSGNPLSGPPTGPRGIEQRQRAVQMTEMRKMGATLQQVGDRFGTTDKRVSQIVNAELRRTSHEAARTYKELITAQRFDLLRTYWPLARGLPYEKEVKDAAGKVTGTVIIEREPDVRAAAIVDRQLEAVAKLWGLEKLVVDVNRTQEERSEALYQQIMAYRQGRQDKAAEGAPPAVALPPAPNGEAPNGQPTAL